MASFTGAPELKSFQHYLGGPFVADEWGGQVLGGRRFPPLSGWRGTVNALGEALSASAVNSPISEAGRQWSCQTALHSRALHLSQSKNMPGYSTRLSFPFSILLFLWGKCNKLICSGFSILSFRFFVAKTRAKE